MKRFYLLLLVAVITFAVIYFIKNPDLVNQVWLYVVGLFGAVIKFFQVAIKRISEWFSRVSDEKKDGPASATVPAASPLSQIIQKKIVIKG